MKNKRGYFYVFFAASFFAVIAIIGKTVMNTGMRVFDLIALQYLMTVIIIFIYFLFTGIGQLKIDKKQAKAIIVQGIIGSCGTTILYYMTLERVNAGIASMLLFTYPAWVNVYYLIFQGKKANLINDIALLLALSGCAMVIDIFNIDIVKTPIIGLILGGCSSLAYAFYNVYAEKRLTQYKPLVITFYTSVIILLCALLINPGFLRFDFAINGKLLFYMFELSIISGILPLVFLYKGINLIGAERASIVSTGELPITLILAYIFLGEKMNLMQISGIVFIIISIIILQNEDTIFSFAKQGVRMKK